MSEFNFTNTRVPNSKYALGFTNTPFLTGAFFLFSHTHTIQCVCATQATALEPIVFPIIFQVRYAYG